MKQYNTAKEEKRRTKTTSRQLTENNTGEQEK